MKPQLPRPVLVDARNVDELYPKLVVALTSGAALCGIDCETEDSARHPGLAKFCKEQEDGSTRRTVFDLARMRMTGFSLWPEGWGECYYVNLGHADGVHRLPFERVRPLLDLYQGLFVAHNAPFEIVAFRNCLGYDLAPRLLCSLQLCVSAYGPDEYDADEFARAGLGGFNQILRQVVDAGRTYQGERDKMTPAQAEVFAQIVGKSSKAAHSYNGYVKELAFGYGLKQAVRSWFGHEMTTYEEVLAGRGHMGQLTAAEVLSYGCDDAYWAVRLFRHVEKIIEPAALVAYYGQELPMVPVYADMWRTGMRVDLDAIRERRRLERAGLAAVLRRLRAAVRSLLPFPAAPHRGLQKYDKWYASGGEKYRALIQGWAGLPDEADDVEELLRARGPSSNALAEELRRPESVGPNFSHYMPVRTLLYDLLGAELVVSKGKVQSDGEARGKIKERLTDPTKVEVVDCLNEMARIEQVMKLYLTPYEQLTDPDTRRLHPNVTSQLATRRMASQHPNPMQLAKQGGITYVRGFYRGDRDDHVVVSIDWSGIELVIIGELSGDPAFLEAYGQRPHRDLHSKATAGILSFELDRPITPELVKALPRMGEEEVLEVFGPKVLVNTKGERMTPAQAYKFHRGTDGGKGANFNYWYSGALGTLADRRGWTQDQHWRAVEAYRAEFPVAEAWRVGLIDEVCTRGQVTLPDGHRRVRFEATPRWRELFMAKWADLEIDGFIGEVARSIQTRARNQAVNAMVQGTCATVAKRSAVRIRQRLAELGWGDSEARFMIPIHDELVFSVRKDLVVEFNREAHAIMCDHPDLFKRTVLDASPSVGLTFEPFHPKKAPFGQVELHEAPDILGLPAGQRLDDDQIRLVVDYLTGGRQ